MALMDKSGEKLKLVDVTKLLFYVYKIFPVCSNWAFVDYFVLRIPGYKVKGCMC